MEGMIREFDPPRVFEYDWVSPYETTIVRYELKQESSGTRLTLTEHLLTEKDTERRGAGWHAHLERLELYLGSEESPASEARWKQLREQYAKLL